MTDEWGPWIEHVPGPCPCVGAFVDMVGSCSCGAREQGIAKDTVEWMGETWLNCFTCGDEGFLTVARYRIRKPRGMTVLQEIVASPERELEGVE